MSENALRYDKTEVVFGPAVYVYIKSISTKANCIFYDSHEDKILSLTYSGN